MFSNRDEKITRPPSAEPLIHERDGVRFLAPLDMAFGGSWIACNELGVSVCLLNGRTGLRRPCSRRLLVLDVAGARSQADVVARMQSRDLYRFASFSLVASEPGKAALMLSWDGWGLSLLENVQAPLASSSFDFDGVRRVRMKQLAKVGDLSAAKLRAFHSSHEDGPGPYLTCMHRPDARTVSFTEVCVKRGMAKMI